MEQPIFKKDKWDDQTSYVCQFVIKPEEQSGQTEKRLY